MATISMYTYAFDHLMHKWLALDRAYRHPHYNAHSQQVRHNMADTAIALRREMYQLQPDVDPDIVAMALHNKYAAREDWLSGAARSPAPDRLHRVKASLAYADELMAIASETAQTCGIYDDASIILRAQASYTAAEGGGRAERGAIMCKDFCKPDGDFNAYCQDCGSAVCLDAVGCIDVVRKSYVTELGDLFCCACGPSNEPVYEDDVDYILD